MRMQPHCCSSFCFSIPCMQTCGVTLTRREVFASAPSPLLACLAARKTSFPANSPSCHSKAQRPQTGAQSCCAASRAALGSVPRPLRSHGSLRARRLLQERSPALHGLPHRWLHGLLARAAAPGQSRDDILRRSAGLPAAIVALFLAEPANQARKVGGAMPFLVAWTALAFSRHPGALLCPRVAWCEAITQAHAPCLCLPLDWRAPCVCALSLQNFTLEGMSVCSCISIAGGRDLR